MGDLRLPFSWPPSRLEAAVLALVAFALLAFAAHSRAYYSGPGSASPSARDAQLLQTSAQDITPDMLSERQPLVLVDELVVPNHKALLSSVFRWQYISSRSRAAVREGASRARFTLLSPFHDSAVGQSVVSIHPVSRPALRVDVLLALGRTLVLPPRWAWSADGPLRETCLHDPATLLLKLFSWEAGGAEPRPLSQAKP